MKNFYKYSGFLLSLFLMLTISCQDFTEPNDELLKSGKISQNTPPKGKNKTPAELTNQETDGILYLREEEKLAHDVYVQFYALYQNNIFLNVIDAEQRHTDAILDLINFYSLTDPTAGKAVGEFLNTDLQARYDSLVGIGQVSLIQAIDVSVFIETTLIEDLNRFMAQTTIKNLLQVYGHLLTASENHLKSFEKKADKLSK